MLNYRSTRLKAPIVPSVSALINGLAPDGGLYLPEQLPVFDLQALLPLSYDERALMILQAFFDDLDRHELQSGIQRALSRFDTPAIAPVTPCGSQWLLELDHGPTAAFKDIALTLLPTLMGLAKNATHDASVTHILTATSGDTGSAALAGFAGVPGFFINVFYPSRGISTIQQRQMTTVSASNVRVAAIHGNFDDAQNAVKAVFGQADRFPFTLSSANSINIGRLMPQVVYYVSAYLDLVNANVIEMGQPMDVAVPSGNFGNLLAAYLAKRCGVPIERLICASNENHVLTDFFRTGCYDRNRPFRVTTSPSMDILVSSNLERVLSLVGADDRIGTWMDELVKTGTYTVDEATLQALQSTFIAEWVDEATVQRTIATAFTRDHRLIDPHTAVAVAAAARHGSDRPMLIASTASPFKFPATVLHALGHTVDADDVVNLQRLEKVSGLRCPPALAACLAAPIVHTQCIEPQTIFQYLHEKELP
jgi:threonine synthase